MSCYARNFVKFSINHRKSFGGVQVLNVKLGPDISTCDSVLKNIELKVGKTGPELTPIFM